MGSLSKYMLASAYWAVEGLVGTVRALPRAMEVVREASYRPDAKRKAKFRRLADNVAWCIRNHEANLYYNLYGLDLEGTPVQGDFIAYRRFRNDRRRMNQARESDATVILRDKNIFAAFCDFYCLPHPATEGIVEVRGGERTILWRDGKEPDFPLFVKGRYGECGEGVYRVSDNRSLGSVRLSDGDYLIQEAVRQHPSMCRVGPGSVNTVRIITVMERESPKLFSAILRCGTSDSGDVDNTSAGGIAVGVDFRTGKLRGSGVRKPEWGGLVNCHPDTGERFEGFAIPFWEEAVRLALSAQSKIRTCPTVGWDIAIGESGPLLIEGNDNWEIQTVQALYGGCRSEWKALMEGRRGGERVLFF